MLTDFEFNVSWFTDNKKHWHSVQHVVSVESCALDPEHPEEGVSLLLWFADGEGMRLPFEEMQCLDIKICNIYEGGICDDELPF